MKIILSLIHRAKVLAVAAVAVAASTATAAAATLTVSVPDTYSDGIDFSQIIQVIGIVGGGVIGVMLGIKLIRWIMASFM